MITRGDRGDAFPYSLDKEYMPDAKRVLKGIRRTVNF